MHGRAEAGVDGPVERFRIDSTRVAERTFQGVHERELFGAWIPDPGIDQIKLVGSL